MASYKDIQGFNIQSLSSDPVPFAQEKANNPWAGVWSSGGSLNTVKSASGSTGSQTAGITFGGDSTPTPKLANTELYNGTSWTEVNDLNTARSSLGAAGTQTACLGVAGYLGPPGVTTAVESWDGTNWTTGTAVNTARYINEFSVGTQTAALVFQGYSPALGAVAQNVEQWNGSSWTEVAEFNTTRRIGGGFGTSTDALASTGLTPPGSAVANVESWNGTSWTEVNDVNNARYSLGSTSTPSSTGLIFGGNDGAINFTESWDGSTWTEVNDMATARTTTGAGTSSESALAIGGYTGAFQSLTEEWTFSGIPPTTPAVGYSDALFGQIYYNTSTGSFKGVTTGISAWSSAANMPTARMGMRSGGTPTAAILWGGDDTWTPITSTFEYDGSAWTTGGTTSTGAYGYGMGAGSQTSALSMGGYVGPTGGTKANAEVYNGTSWTTITSLPTGLYNAGATVVGTSTDGNVFGGNSGPSLTASALNQNWNGSAWTELGDLTAPSIAGQACGTPSAAIYFGGTGVLSNIWNGTSWTSVPATFNTPRSDGAMSGSSTSALAFGGEPTGLKTEKWDGTSWTEVNDLGTARYGKNGRGSQITNSDTAITMGGYGTPAGQVTTEEWTTTDFTINTLTTS